MISRSHSADAGAGSLAGSLADSSLEPALGLEPGRVLLRPHDPAWRDLFEQERRELLRRIGPDVLDIQHVGSTAIPGIMAKPIIDIAVAVESFEEAVVCIAPLEELGYEYKGELGIPRRHYFARGHARTHHLHMVEIASEQWRVMTLFRDYLRAHPAEAAAYQALKLDLATRFPDDREGYTAAKAPFIEGLLRRARLWPADARRADVRRAAGEPGHESSGSDTIG